MSRSSNASIGSERLKPIIKQSIPDLNSSNETIEIEQSHDANPSLRHSRRSTLITESSGSNFFHLTVPSFFGGGGGKGRISTDSSRTRGRTSSASFQSSGIDSVDNSSRHVRFLDRLSYRSISAINMQSMTSLRSLERYDVDRLQDQDSARYKDDPNYLPGFVDLFYAKEIFIKETSLCFYGTSHHYEITDDSDKVIYAVEKEIDGYLPACAKLLCFKNVDIMRVGYSICIFNPTVKTKLLTFIRRTHWFAEQLDIVETFYSIEDAHVGRIEKTKEGFRIVDAGGNEMFRIVREKKGREDNDTYARTHGTLIVLQTGGMKIVAKITYSKMKLLGRMASMFLPSFKHIIRWNQEIGVTAKALLIGTLLLEIHSTEKFVDYPLGRDAVPARYRHHSRPH